jgi:geranylgeranyl pyrophosphate synthase
MNSAILAGAGTTAAASFLEDVHATMLSGLQHTSLAPLLDEISPSFIGGKMLRARLTHAVGSACGTDRDTLLHAGAAVEMVHAASLLHDDVIDEAMLRRGTTTFWKKKGVSGAILLGDLLVCQSMQLLHGIDDGRLGMMLVRLAGEMCDAEVEQELISREAPKDWNKSVSIARRKTGSLFAFAATAADGADEVRTAALLEAGYRIGTAYQLADDILDACGMGVGDGKDLGKDARMGKNTSVSAAGGSADPARQSIHDCCVSSAGLLASWPSVQDAWNAYLQADFGPVVKQFSGK